MPRSNDSLRAGNKPQICRVLIWILLLFVLQVCTHRSVRSQVEQPTPELVPHILFVPVLELNSPPQARSHAQILKLSTHRVGEHSTLQPASKICLMKAISRPTLSRGEMFQGQRNGQRFSNRSRILRGVFNSFALIDRFQFNFIEASSKLALQREINPVKQRLFWFRNSIRSWGIRAIARMTGTRTRLIFVSFFCGVLTSGRVGSHSSVEWSCPGS